MVAAGLVSVGIAVIYRVMRSGFGDPLLPVAKAVAFALFIFTFPAAARWILSIGGRRADRADSWWRSYPFLWLSALGLTSALGRFVPHTGPDIYPVIAGIGVISFGALLVRWLRAADVSRTAATIAGCAAFSVWTSGVVWGTIHKNPLFHENFILGGNVHHDSLTLAAIGNMLRTYRVASTGIDGLGYVPSSWGCQWLFAQWSSLLRTGVLEFYQLGFAVTIVPFFFMGILAFAVAMRNRRRGPEAREQLTGDGRFWLVFLAASLGMIPISALGAMGMRTSNVLDTESYTVAVPCALLFLATVILFLDRSIPGGPSSPSGIRRVTDSLFVVVGIPAGIMLLGYIRLSFMELALALAVYAFLRLRLYRQPLYIASAAVASALFYITFTQVSISGQSDGFAAFAFFRSFVRPAWWPVVITVHLFWSWLYIVIRLRAEGVGTIGDLKDAAAERRILDVEAVALVAVLGLASGLRIYIDGGSAFNFSDIQPWLAVGLLLSRIPMFAAAIAAPPPKRRLGPRRTLLSRLDAISSRSVLIVFLLGPVVASMASNAVAWPLRMVRANIDTRRALYTASGSPTSSSGVGALFELRDRGVLQRGLRQSPNFALANALGRVASLPESVRRHTALFIPQDQTTYWKSLSRSGECAFQSFVAPALASIVMIDGIPPYGCALGRYYGLGSFAPRLRQQSQDDAQPKTLCRRASDAGMNRVLMLTFDSVRSAKLATIPCEGP